MGSSGGLIENIERRLQNCRIHEFLMLLIYIFYHFITLLDAQILFSFIFTVELTVRFVVEISVANIQSSAVCCLFPNLNFRRLSLPRDSSTVRGAAGFPSPSHYVLLWMELASVLLNM